MPSVSTPALAVPIPSTPLGHSDYLVVRLSWSNPNTETTFDIYRQIGSGPVLRIGRVNGGDITFECYLRASTGPVSYYTLGLAQSNTITVTV